MTTMRLGNLEFEEVEAGSETQPLILEAREPLDVLRFTRDNAEAVAELWESQPVFAIMNTLALPYPGLIPPDVSPSWHTDFASERPANRWIGFFLINDHELNTRGDTEHQDGPFCVALLTSRFAELTALFGPRAQVDPVFAYDVTEALTLLSSSPDPQDQVFAANRIYWFLQEVKPYGNSPLALEIIGELDRHEARKLPWVKLPHSTGFVSQRGLHRSGESLYLEDAKPLHRFYVGKKDGVVRASYRIPEDTEELPSSLNSL